MQKFWWTIGFAVLVVRNDEKEMKMREEEKKYDTAIAQQEQNSSAIVEKLVKQPEEELTAMEKRVEELEKEDGYGFLSEGRAC